MLNSIEIRIAKALLRLSNGGLHSVSSSILHDNLVQTSLLDEDFHIMIMRRFIDEEYITVRTTGFSGGIKNSTDSEDYIIQVEPKLVNALSELDLKNKKW